MGLVSSAPLLPSRVKVHSVKYNTIIHRRFLCSKLWWRRLVVRKWLNKANNNYSDDSESDSEQQEIRDRQQESTGFTNGEADDEVQVDVDEALSRLRRRKSETFRARYINAKEIRICAATWNVGGIAPPDDLNLDDWLDIDDPADICVIGFCRVV